MEAFLVFEGGPVVWNEGQRIEPALDSSCRVFAEHCVLAIETREFLFIDSLDHRLHRRLKR